MSMRSGAVAVLIGATIILALAASLVQTSIETHHGPVPGQGLGIVFLLPPSLVLIAWGIAKGAKQLPERGRWQRKRDIVILSSGGAIGALVILWVALIMFRPL